LSDGVGEGGWRGGGAGGVLERGEREPEVVAEREQAAVVLAERGERDPEPECECGRGVGADRGGGQPAGARLERAPGGRHGRRGGAQVGRRGAPAHLRPRAHQHLPQGLGQRQAGGRARPLPARNQRAPQQAHAGVAGRERPPPAQNAQTPRQVNIPSPCQLTPKTFPDFPRLPKLGSNLTTSMCLQSWNRAADDRSAL
jgi:hypothetical protein